MGDSAGSASFAAGGDYNGARNAKISQVKFPGATPLFVEYDGTFSGYAAGRYIVSSGSGARQSLLYSDVHNGFSNLTFTDGHTQPVRASDLSNPDANWPSYFALAYPKQNW